MNKQTPYIQFRAKEGQLPKDGCPVSPQCCIGQVLRRKRELLGISIQTLAIRLAVEVVAIERMENRKRIAIRLLARIARAMQIELSDITELSEEAFKLKHRNKMHYQVNY